MQKVKELAGLVPFPTLLAILLIPCLLLVDTFCYQITLPLTITFQHHEARLSVGSTVLNLGKVDQPLALQFGLADPLVHEYQIDGSDSTNNQDLDTSYLASIADSPYYALQSWMRDLDGTSRWRDLIVQANGKTFEHVAWPADASQVNLPPATTLQISLQWQRPETARSLNLVLDGNDLLEIRLDRNSRQLTVTDEMSGKTLAHAFFPVDVAPFAAMLLDTLARITLWSCVLLLAVQTIELLLSLLTGLRWRLKKQSEPAQAIKQTWRDTDPINIAIKGPNLNTWLPQLSTGTSANGTAELHLSARGGRHEGSVLSQSKGVSLQEKVVPNGRAQQNSSRSVERLTGWIKNRIRHLSPFPAIHPIGIIALGCSLVFVIWIAVKEYQGQPHIYDAQAYIFGAKMLAAGEIAAPAPLRSTLFPGPFIVIFQGLWFPQYEPGTSLTLVPGIWFNCPWLVEPLLGSFALLGIGLIAARLYDRKVATLAVLLGCLSPFYSFLAASYLSHCVALFYLVWGLWAFLRFAQGEQGWNMILSGLCFGMAFLTRDFVTLLYIILLIPGVVFITWDREKLQREYRRWISWGLIFIAIAILFANIYVLYNLLLTDNPLLTPRWLYYPPDVWGFGQGIGFYGEHTPAAGLVNLDELLTILQIDLFGWPFYLTLAFLGLPFLLKKSRKSDWFLLLTLIVTAGSYMGYFYHGIYLGPRYLFEDLPFLLILTARGMLLLNTWGREQHRLSRNWWPKFSRAMQPEISLVTLLLVIGLLLCNLIYYLPRQITRYQNYSGLKINLNTSQIYDPPVHHAIVVTGNTLIYQEMLFSLNDPGLQGDVIYAEASLPSQYQALLKEFPGRMLYQLEINEDGSVTYLPYQP